MGEMLASVSGTIREKANRYIILENGGFGFRVFMAADAIASLPGAGSEAKLFTHLHLRENETLELYGMRTKEELTFFEMLLTVSGIGPKGALGVLSVARVVELEQAIVSGDASLLTRVSGIGRKTAQKIILELKEKLVAGGVGEEGSVTAGAQADALDALVKLGYKQREAREALRAVADEAHTSEEKIKAALKLLGRRS